MDIYLYSVGFEKNTLKNPEALPNYTTISGKVFDPLNVVNPVVEVNVENVEQYNLIKIPTNNRWYWIKEYEYIAEGYVSNLHCESAVLLNWYEAIINTRIKVTKSTRFYNKHLVDSNFPILDQRKITIDKFPKALASKDCVLLTTLGGYGGGI